MKHDPIPVPVSVPDGVPAGALDLGGATTLQAALAEELRIASRLLNDLAYDLASDGAVIRTHMESLQKIDLVTQMQLSVASVLESGGAGEAQVFVGLEDMAARLQAACAPLSGAE